LSLSLLAKWIFGSEFCFEKGDEYILVFLRFLWKIRPLCFVLCWVINVVFKLLQEMFFLL
jgi:hypothetical protein